ncbi:hypothetical protein [Paracoccus acridae]|uniref:hypothetical protein n=1 Tax=Paracoccus acridae TaxID=1795310 RepID=UPI001666FADD|nr:hypothetical protein [Paracoccus acridae]
MTSLRPDLHSFSDHPLEVLDQPAAGYILDLVYRFRLFFEWPFDQEVLYGLLFLALPHVSASGICTLDDNSRSLWEALIWRLQAAGDLAQDEHGFVLTPHGQERRCSTFQDILAAPAWSQALEQVHEYLEHFAETEGVPLAKALSLLLPRPI